MFQVPERVQDSISHRLARAAMPVGGTVLDVGCGGGVAAFALTPPASHIIGVDHQPEMLAMFIENAKSRNIDAQTFEGFWPEIADKTPIADIVTSHHVVYNVAQIEDFLVALGDHARHRVVIEMPQHHPLTNASPLWKHFWNVKRPSDPTPENLMNVLKELGFNANLELWEGLMRQEVNLEQFAHLSRIRLCLPAEREGEVLDFLKNQPKEEFRNLATIWWDRE